MRILIVNFQGDEFLHACYRSLGFSDDQFVIVVWYVWCLESSYALIISNKYILIQGIHMAQIWFWRGL